MHAAPMVFMAEIAIPSARQCLTWGAPFIVLAAAFCIVGRMDQIMDRLFPNWEWEKKMGWLDFRAQRQAERILRWIAYFVCAMLGLSLLGIVWAAKGLVAIDHWNDPYVLSDLARRIPVLLACLGLWLVYLGCELVPKIRGRYEEEELEKFRAEQKALEEEHDRNPFPSRLKSPHVKHGANPPVAPTRNRLR